MKIEIKRQYKSVMSFTWDNIPDFSVITGINGTGKTQFLELLSKAIRAEGDFANYVSLTPGVPLEAFRFISTNWALTNQESIGLETVQTEVDAFIQTIEEFVQTPTAKKFRRSKRRVETAVKALEEAAGKNIKDISEDERRRLFPISLILEDTTTHNEKLANVFYAYFARKIQLDAARVEPAEVTSILGPAPWDVMNNIFKEAGFSYTINNPTNLLGKFRPKLYDSSKNIEIDFADLSSGEKVIASASLWLFNSNFGAVPELMIIDEPDAHLHPSLTRQLIEVIKHQLVGKYKIKVIMTTHSPSTVTFVPDGSLFEMSKSPTTQIVPISVSRAVSVLTSNLLIVSKNSKFVFVEDEDDRGFYDSLFKLTVDLRLVESETSLVFIPVSSRGNGAIDSGGKSKVRDFTRKLCEAGNSQTIGLIDKDENNQPEQNVFVLDRYSMENYLLDPVLVFTSLLEFKHADVTEFAKTIGIGYGENEKIRALPSDKLQNIADFIVGKLDASKIDPSLKNSWTITYTNGKQINVGNFMRKMRGHDLHTLFRNAYGNPSLSLNELKASMEKIHLIPIDLIASIKALQDHT